MASIGSQRRKEVERPFWKEGKGNLIGGSTAKKLSDVLG